MVIILLTTFFVLLSNKTVCAAGRSSRGFINASTLLKGVIFAGRSKTAPHSG